MAVAVIDNIAGRRGPANLRRLPQRLIALEPREMTIDTLCAPNVKTETKQGAPAAQLEPLAPSKGAV